MNKQSSPHQLVPIRIPAGHFIYPQAICVDDREHLWVANPYVHELVQLNNDGAVIQVLSPPEIPLATPDALVCSRDGLVVLDAGNQSVIDLSFTSRKAVVRTLKNEPINFGKATLLSMPNDGWILFDKDRITLFRLNQSGAFNSIQLAPPSEPTQFKATAAALGPNGSLFLIGSGKPAIYSYNLRGELQHRFVLAELYLLRPTALAFHNEDLWVVDEGRKALLHFVVQSASTALDHQLLGEEYLALGHAKQAAEEFQKATRLGGETAEVDLLRGQALHSLGDLQGALDRFQRADVLQPGNTDNWMWIGQVHADTGSYREALQSYQEVLEKRPDYQPAYYNLGLIYMQLGRLDEAERQISSSFRLKPEDELLKLALGRIYLQRNEYAEAGSIFEMLLQSKNLGREARYYLGVACLESGEFQRALQYLQAASRQGPFFSDSFYALGTVYSALKETEKAGKSYLQALKINPNHAEARKALEKMR